MALVEELKPILRVTSSDAGIIDEISDLIKSAKMDMKLQNINIDKITDDGEMDPLIKRAVILYCKGNFGYDNPDAKSFISSYEKLRDHLSLSTDYRMVVACV